METLAAQIARDGRLGAPEAAGWVIRLAKRLEGTHRQGLVHGNVSAYCLLVESRNPLSRGLLIDVPRVAEPVFHSPERAASGQTSQPDDAWALGVTLFYALTGQYPFPGANDAEVRQKALAGAPRLNRFGITDTALQGLLDQVFARDINRRADIATFRAGIERWVNDPNIASLPGLEDDDEDQPTMMMAQASVGSAKQQPPPAPEPPAPRGAPTLLGMGSPSAPLPAAGRPAPAPLPPPPPAPLPAAGMPAPMPAAGMPPAPAGLGAMPPVATPPGFSPDALPPSMPQVSARAAPTILQVREPAKSGLATSTVALLVAVWLVITFGGAAIEYVVLTRM